jgi:hypothetical protein
LKQPEVINDVKHNPGSSSGSGRHNGLVSSMWPSKDPMRLLGTMSAVLFQTIYADPDSE